MTNFGFKGMFQIKIKNKLHKIVAKSLKYYLELKEIYNMWSSVPFMILFLTLNKNQEFDTNTW